MMVLRIADFAVPLAVGLSLLLWTARVGLSRRAALTIGLIGLAFFLARTVPRSWIDMPEGRFDFTAFWDVGAEIRAGQDPISLNDQKSLPIINPPTAYPLFALLSCLPYRASFQVWTLCNAAFALLLAWVSWRIVVSDRPRADDDRPTLILFAAALCLSNATRASLTSGQLTLLVALGLASAELFRRRGHWIASALGLAVGTIKIGTMIPFLSLFLSRRGARVWVIVGLIGLACACSVGDPAKLPERAGLLLKTIGRLSQEGAINDPALPTNDDMIEIDRALYLTGLFSRTGARVGQGLILVVLGGLLIDEIVRRKRLSPNAQFSLVCLYASIFLYHRLADMVILAPALAFCVDQARQEPARKRGLLWGATLALLIVLFNQRRGMVWIRLFADAHPGLSAGLIRALILPHVCWLILLVFTLIYLKGRRQLETKPPLA